jgi:hypothetical protein
VVLDALPLAYKPRRIPVGTSDTLLLPVNSRRRMLLISAPAAVTNPESFVSAYVNDADTSVVATILTLTAPADSQLLVETWALRVQVGTPSLVFEILTSIGTLGIVIASADVFYSAKILVEPGDNVHWRTFIAGGGGSSCDAAIVGRLLGVEVQPRVSVSFGEPAVLDGGLTLQPDMAPVRLDYNDIGSMLTREIRGIASQDTVIGIAEIGWP